MRFAIGDMRYAICEETMTVTFRRGTMDDSFAVFKVFEESVLDLSQRQGTMGITGGSDSEVLAETWTRRQSLFEHLARTAHEFWIAEVDGRAVGYARSIMRDGVLELTEFFVLPSAQSAGVGGELLRRAFPTPAGAFHTTEAKHRVIIATTDVRAQARYLKTGVVPRFPSMYWGRAPENFFVESDLEFARAENSREKLDTLAEIDRAILGHARDADHVYLMETRELFLYRRAGKVVGYGYLASATGPVALLEARDFSAVMAHAERAALARGDKEIGFEIPMINRAAIDYLLARNYKLDSFITLFMSDAEFGKFENYIFTSPPFFV